MGNKASVIIDNTLPSSKGYATHRIIAATLPDWSWQIEEINYLSRLKFDLLGSIRVFMDFAELETDGRNYSDKIFREGLKKTSTSVD